MLMPPLYPELLQNDHEVQPRAQERNLESRYIYLLTNLLSVLFRHVVD